MTITKKAVKRAAKQTLRRLAVARAMARRRAG